MSDRRVCELCGSDMEIPDEVTLEQLQAALAFYENAPDGHYDTDVVVPLLQAELRRRTL